MLKVIQSPAKYLQGPDAAVLFGQYAKNLADSFFVIADDFVMKLAGEKVVNGLQSHDIRCHAERFNGECSHAEINRLMAILQKQGCRGVVGIGGGKTLDTAKAIGYYQKLPVVVIPTIASTDAPTSALSVIYTEAGEFEEYLIYPKNPDMVVMDTAIIAKSAGTPAGLRHGRCALDLVRGQGLLRCARHQHGRGAIHRGGAEPRPPVL